MRKVTMKMWRSVLSMMLALSMVVIASMIGAMGLGTQVYFAVGRNEAGAGFTAGLAIVIVREDLLGNARDYTPTMLNYQTHADAESLYNTPPCYIIYICKLVLEWIKGFGGLEEMKAHNEKKAKILYDYLETIEQLDVTATYSSLVSGDFNLDEADDILLISLYSSDVTANAKMLSYTKGSLSEVSTTELSPDVTSFSKVQYGQIAYGVYGAVIDGITSTGDYTTQVVLFDSSRPALLNPLYTYSGYGATRRSTQLCSLDFDNDKLIDIPVCKLMPYSEDEAVSTVSIQVDWSNFDTTSYTLKTNFSSILCPKDGYSLTIPQKWTDVVTARYNEKEHETTVSQYKYVGNTFKLTGKIVSIKAYKEEEFDKNSSGYIEFLRSGSTVYAYSLGKADDYLSISGDELQTMFTLVNQ